MLTRLAGVERDYAHERKTTGDILAPLVTGQGIAVYYPSTDIIADKEPETMKILVEHSSEVIQPATWGSELKAAKIDRALALYHFTLQQPGAYLRVLLNFNTHLFSLDICQDLTCA